jgi:hypothetical protein
MKKIFTLFLLTTIYITYGLAQEKLITGRLTDRSGSPMPGVNIVVKGTTKGTTTDADGYYSISAPVGSTLVFAFIGMTTQEIVVTADDPRPRKSKNEPVKQKSKLQNSVLSPADTIHTKKGYVVLTPATSTYTGTPPVNASDIRSIRKLGNHYYFKRYEPGPSRNVHLQFTTVIGLEQITNLPALQYDFAQGRPAGGTNQWIGPENKEIFSWGPLIRTLEFDGEDYPFDNNGRLTEAGSGNGLPAKSYPALSFFKTGVTKVAEVKITKNTKHYGNLSFIAEKRNRTGVIPNTNYDRTNMVFSAKKIKLTEKIKLNSSFSYNHSEGRLLTRGGNTTSIIGSVFRTPVTFDNTNGFSTEEATNNRNAFLLEDGTMRSHAPGLTDNPYALVNMLPDNEKLDRIFASLDLDYNLNKFNISFNSSLDQQWSKNIFGIPPGFSGYLPGRMTNRNDDQTYLNTVVTPSYYLSTHSATLKLSLVYQNQVTTRNLNRQDGFEFNNEDVYEIPEGDSVVIKTNSLQRIRNEILFNALYNYKNKFTVRVSNRTYFSNTLDKRSYTNVLPAAGIKINITNLANAYWSSELNLFSSISKTINETPLLYTDWSYAFTNHSINTYNSFYEANELLFNKGLLPESERKFESGLSFFNSGFESSITYYNNITRDFIAPSIQGSSFRLTNAATVSNSGFIAKAGYRTYYYNDTMWGVELSFDQYNNKVEELNTSTSPIPIAGFNTIQTVLASGKPVGAIYGTSYQRNGEGVRVIGEEGFPLVNTELRMIGNPIPEWKLGWNGFIERKGIQLKIAFEYKEGGEVFNGTQAALDYMGRSANTGKERGITNYVFEGVTENGVINTKSVTFADAGKPLEENKWVRYGFGGVGEEYIEDASWFRLTDVTLSYTHKTPPHVRTVREMTFSLVGQNLLLISPYSGVDPATKLFGYTNGSGIDLFNQPSTRSYSLQITIKI